MRTIQCGNKFFWSYFIWASSHPHTLDRVDIVMKRRRSWAQKREAGKIWKCDTKRRRRDFLCKLSRHCFRFVWIITLNYSTLRPFLGSFEFNVLIFSEKFSNKSIFVAQSIHWNLIWFASIKTSAKFHVVNIIGCKINEKKYFHSTVSLFCLSTSRGEKKTRREKQKPIKFMKIIKLDLHPML